MVAGVPDVVLYGLEAGGDVRGPFLGLMCLWALYGLGRDIRISSAGLSQGPSRGDSVR